MPNPPASPRLILRLTAACLLAPCLTLCAASLALSAQTPPPAKRSISLDDLARIARVGSPVLSPDGAWVLYTVSRIDAKEDKSHSELWMVRWDGSSPTQLTYGKDGVNHPAFSPDGKYISFLSSRPGKAKGQQVWVLNRLGGEADQFTAVTDQDLNDFAWSPDSKTLLLTLEPKSEPDAEEGKPPAPPKPILIDRYHFKQDIQGYLRNDQREALYLLNLATKKVEKLTTDKLVDELNPVWSPDGQSIAYVSNHDADPDRTDNTDIYIVPAKPGSTAKRLTTWKGPDGGHLVWSPDSKSIAYTQGAPVQLGAYSQARPAVVTVDGQVTYPAAQLDRSVSSPCFTADGLLIYLVMDDRSHYPAILDSTGAQRLLAEPGATGSLDCIAGHIAVNHQDDTHLPEIFALEGHSLRQLSHVNDALLAELNLATTQDFTSHSPDGTEVHGLLTLPLGYKAGDKVPTLLFIHGGPNGEDEHNFAFERQFFAAHGYAEINVNYRGSAGRGQAYAKAIFADWGHLEVIDLLGAVDQVVKMGVADPAHLAIGGWSYGGILTDYTTASDNRFKAAIAGAGSAAPLSFYGTDQYILQYDFELGVPWNPKNLALYLKLSYPLLEADKRMHTPTLYMGGTNDFNVPIIGGEQMYQALKSLNVPTELVVYPGQFHGFTRPSFVRDRYERWLAWYDHYARGLDVPATPTPKPEPVPTPTSTPAPAPPAKTQKP
jgi:dipeptidyl aminopeptidase/acylaminoacyl peptidase